MRSLKVKRAIDVVGAAAGIVVFALPMAAIALWIRLRMGRPVLFTQTRSGLAAQPFVIYKFRTMRDVVGPDGRPLPDAQRLTAMGRFLRSMSLDELPTFWNVLRGDMSLVGPRPLLMEYLDRYTERQARRHDVRPGMTGLSQVKGRNALDWEHKLALDAEYAERWTVGLDLWILLRTVWKVLTREGINQPGQETTAPFEGTPEPEER